MATTHRAALRFPAFSGASRIAFYSALRGTVAAAVPFLLLRHAGLPVEALFATIAVLNVSIGDSGGPYGQRLAAMTAIALVVPLVLLAGLLSQSVWWLAVALMFLVALLGGLARLYGAVGTALGVISSIVFLIGIEVPADLRQSLYAAAAYFGGAVWTVLIALVVWRLRPYRRVRYELGEGFRQLALLLRRVREQSVAPVSRGPGEERLAADQRRARATLESAEHILGETLAGTEGVPAFLSDLVVLIRCGLRVNAAAASLGSALDRPHAEALSDDSRKAMAGLLEAFETVCIDIALALLDRTAGRRSLGAARERLQQWEQSVAGGARGEIDTLANVILVQLEAGQRVMERLAEPNLGARLLPPLHGRAFPAVNLATLRANLSFRSLVFRHALRAAVTASAATAAYLLFGIPHGMWLALTVVIVLQPQLGPTLTRALQRTAGTVLGAVVAGVLVYLFRNSAGMEAAILVCLFLTLLFFRQRYWLAIVFLTPLIILLLSLLVHHPWISIVERIGNTLGGAALALLAASVLWPNREYRQLPEATAEAIEANRRYLAALARAAAQGVEPGWPLSGVRAEAELATTNARASLERMLTEPRWSRRASRRAIAAVAHLERLCRHVSRLSIYLHENADVVPDFGPLTRAFDETLGALASAARHSQPPQADPSLEQAYFEARHGWRERLRERADAQASIDALVGSVVGDIQSLRAAMGDGG
ncbi:MAG TPA: FUSC family protein [Gammaproteobacteria bacterium]|nr:FUSC family protein [Gammaproteobacteria bacterium]